MGDDCHPSMSVEEARAFNDGFKRGQQAGLLKAARRMPEIIEVLFVNGQDARADRLVLTVDGADPSDLGGWCRAAAAEAMAAKLRALAGEEPSHD